MIKLNCPSCSAPLEIPDDMNHAHCIHCGTNFVSNENKNVDKIKQLIELSRIALDVGQFSESINYCNKILELDSNYADAWINKAIATYNLSTTEDKSFVDNKYDEAIAYLEKAESLSPYNERIIEATTKIRDHWVLCLNHLGELILKKANLIMLTKGKAQCEPYILEAMEYLLRAAKYRPMNKTILNNIYMGTKMADWKKWPEEVNRHLLAFEEMNSRKF